MAPYYLADVGLCLQGVYAFPPNNQEAIPPSLVPAPSFSSFFPSAPPLLHYIVLLFHPLLLSSILVLLRSAPLKPAKGLGEVGGAL